MPLTTDDTSAHVLLVDDHRDIRETLARYLDRHGLRTTTAEDAAAARRVLRTAALDLVVLDIMMPGEDGLSLCRHLRETTDLPIIFLTALGEPTERVIGLEMGADDYVTKPFEPRELLARVKAVLRRSRSLPVDSTRRRGDSARVAFDGWMLDLGRRELMGADGIAVSLSTSEFLLLEAFVRHPGIVLSRDQLLDLTKGRSADVFDRSIDNQVSRLRRKVEADPRNPTLIKTVWGGGYCFTATVRDEP
ncbi:response regulator [Azospirillum sp.]|uniref:response regulator n=1 Tax=Azospirillum sp. TaxID=34012 RepID=UPI002D575610|nr:response regulator [Azospirillum sp.]HYD68611.1 response regulator [Azospirillum sp.]